MPQRITVAHSPDADDAFMFYALATGKVGDPDFEFVHVLKDIQTLNELAFQGEYEVTAVRFTPTPISRTDMPSSPTAPAWGTATGR